MTILNDGSPSMFLAEAYSPTHGCPPWCVTAHDPSRGEDDWLHVSEPLVLTDGVMARLCMSVDPTTGAEDGPYVLVGDDQLTPAEAERLGIELSALAARALRRQSPGEEA